MHITKMHGLGNSQILVENLEDNLEDETGLDYSKIARALCNPDFGVGSDQMLVIARSKDADFQMRIFNKDGGEAEMCGNGIRCLAKYLYDRDMVDKNPSIETKAGIKDLEIESGEDEIEVDMGEGKILEKEKEVMGFEGSFVSVGNPHFVIFTEKASENLARTQGPDLENAEEFRPEKANIEFAKQTSENEIETYVWERGAGLTLACGTGACATAFAARKKGLVDPETIKINLPGGTLEIKIENGKKIRMRGPAEYILEGEIPDLSKIYSNL